MIEERGEVKQSEKQRDTEREMQGMKWVRERARKNCKKERGKTRPKNERTN